MQILVNSVVSDLFKCGETVDKIKSEFDRMF